MNRYKEFLKWKHSDNVIQIEKGVFVEQCSQYAIRFTRKELYAYFIKEYYNS